MKLSTKLPLAFSIGLLVLLVAALFGIFQLNQALTTYRTIVADSFESERAVSEMLSNFKTQTQEWKNVLLRGKDPKQLDRYWSAFEARDREVASQAGKLQKMLPPGPGKDTIDKFALAHQRMGEAYRKGFADFKAADHDPQAGD